MKNAKMKRTLAFWLAVAMLSSSAPMALAVDDIQPSTTQTGETSEPAQTPVATELTGVTLSESTVTVEGGDGTKTLTATAALSAALGADQTIAWSVTTTDGDTGDVTVAEPVQIAGEPTATAQATITIKNKAKAGTYMIQAKLGDTVKTAALMVVRDRTPKSMQLLISGLDEASVNGKTHEILPGQSIQLTAKLFDAFGEAATGTVKFTKNNGGADSITVGETGTVTVAETAGKDDTATITATYQVEGKAAVTAALTIKALVKDAEITSMTVTAQDKIYDGQPIGTPAVQIEGSTAEQGTTTFTYYKLTAVLSDQDTLTGSTTAPTDAGHYKVVAEYTANEKKAYAEDEFTISPKPLNQDALTLSAEEHTYNGNAQTIATVSVKDDDKALTKDTDYTVAYSDNVDAGTAKVTVTLKGNYTGTLSKSFEIKKATHASVTAQKDSIQANTSKYIPMPTAVTELAGYQAVSLTATEGANELARDLRFAEGEQSVQVSVKNGATGTIKFKATVQSKNYENFEVPFEITITSVAKTKISSGDIVFQNKTVTANGSYFNLDDAKLKDGVAHGENGKWTYAVTNVDLLADNGAMPKFKDAGSYTIRAYYSDDTHEGYKDATLTIQPAVKSTITVSASQMSSRRDDNYSSFDLRERDKEDGYIRLYADADDELVRQTVDGDRAYWIGMDVYPKIGNQETTSGLYVSSDQKSWKKLTGDHRMGDLYIEDVGAKSFELWFDTDGDTDHHDSLYLATDENGANAFRIKVDFDSYYGNSDDDDDKDSDRTSSHTSKVDGDKVATTTIDRTPSVKGGSAKVTISQSVITDAIDENKDEYKHEKADRKVIAIDVNTSKSCDETVVTLAKKSVDKIADADAALRLITKQGTVTIDDRALAAMVADTPGSDIDFYLEKVKDDKFRIYAKSGRTYLTDLGKGDAQAVLPYTLGRNEKASDLRVYRVGDGQNDLTRPVEMEDVSHKSKKLTFTADALGEFRITTDQLTDTGSAAYFYDVPSDRWSAPYIYQLAALGVINGTGANRFEPQLYVTREEFVKMLAGVAGADVSVYRSNSFTDVPSDRWSAPYIAWAANLGVTHGDTPTAFAPAKYITRQEMAAMIYRYVQISGKTLPARNPARTFADDALIADWAEAPVRAMQQAGIIDGNVNYGRYTFDPLLSASREECAKMLAILHDLI